MGSTNIFRLFYRRNFDAKGTIYNSSQIGAQTFTELPISTTKLGDLEITSGDPLTVQSIGGRLYDSFSQKGFSRASGKFNLVYNSDLVSNHTSIFENGFGTLVIPEEISAVTLTTFVNNVATVENSTFGTGNEGVYFYEDNNGEKGSLSIVDIDGANGDATIKFITTPTASPTTITLLNKWDVTTLENPEYYFDILAYGADGICYLLNFVKFNIKLDGSNPATIQELEAMIQSLYIHPDNHTDEIQTALLAKVTGCPEDYRQNGNVVVYEKAIQYGDEYYDNDTVTPTPTDLIGTGDYTDVLYTQEKDMALVTGNASFNNATGIETNSNNISLSISTAGKTEALRNMTTLDAGTAVRYYLEMKGSKFAVLIEEGRLTQHNGETDKDGQHTIDFQAVCNLMCQRKVYVYLG